MMGIVDYAQKDDMKYAIRKLDDTEFKVRTPVLLGASGFRVPPWRLGSTNTHCHTTGRSPRLCRQQFEARGLGSLMGRASRGAEPVRPRLHPREGGPGGRRAPQPQPQQGPLRLPLALSLARLWLSLALPFPLLQVRPDPKP